MYYSYEYQHQNSIESCKKGQIEENIAVGVVHNECIDEFAQK